MNDPDATAVRRKRPRVSLGMPVYNGEDFVEGAVRSLLDQTFYDFELIISDNASTDATGTICRNYASRDSRIRYLRNETNIGFCRNQNRVYALANGDYFLLAHHDDIRAPEYVARTIEVLDADPSIIVCYTAMRDIDEHGNPLPRVDLALRYDSQDARERFRDVIRMDHLCEPDFGLMRLDALRATGLHGDYADSDRVLLAELLLRGRFHRLPEVLFFRRAHAKQSTAIAPDRQSRTIWFDPDKNRGRLIFPHFRQFREYLRAIGRAQIGRRDRAWCYWQMLRWLGTNRIRLAYDLNYSVRQVLRPVYRAVVSKAA